MNSQQPASRGRLRVDAVCATSERILSREVPAHAAQAARPSPPTQPETRINTTDLDPRLVKGMRGRLRA
jgi:hypothetical protein